MTTPETTPAQRIPDADGSAYPWWAIIDPHGVTARLLSRDRAPSAVAFAVHGPFLSRAAAQAEVDGAPHRYSPGTQVWCLSGHRSPDWRALCAEPPDAAARLAAAEAEIERLRAEVDDLRERLYEEGLPTCAREDALEALMGARAVRWWKHLEGDTLEIGVDRGREPEVRAAMTAVGARETGQTTRGGFPVLIFDTAGGEE